MTNLSSKSNFSVYSLQNAFTLFISSLQFYNLYILHTDKPETPWGQWLSQVHTVSSRASRSSETWLYSVVCTTPLWYEIALIPHVTGHSKDRPHCVSLLRCLSVNKATVIEGTSYSLGWWWTFEGSQVAATKPDQKLQSTLKFLKGKSILSFSWKL